VPKRYHVRYQSVTSGLLLVVGARHAVPLRQASFKGSIRVIYWLLCHDFCSTRLSTTQYLPHQKAAMQTSALPSTALCYALPIRHTVAGMMYRSGHGSRATGDVLTVPGRGVRLRDPTHAGAACCRHPQDDNGRRLAPDDVRVGGSSAQDGV